jgi:hypothetical protein
VAVVANVFGTVRTARKNLLSRDSGADTRLSVTSSGCPHTFMAAVEAGSPHAYES